MATYHGRFSLQSKKLLRSFSLEEIAYQEWGDSYLEWL